MTFTARGERSPRWRLTQGAAVGETEMGVHTAENRGAYTKHGRRKEQEEDVETPTFIWQAALGWFSRQTWGGGGRGAVGEHGRGGGFQAHMGREGHGRG